MTLLLRINCLNRGIFSRCKNHRVPFKTDLNLHYVQLYTVTDSQLYIICQKRVQRQRSVTGVFIQQTDSWNREKHVYIFMKYI